ncbi:hypothetical protein [Streptomyces lincolnensis]|uniref:hypothetical protein n=1 Tax=Streptomyces lincolnensis TaxID=1915 RepID=UPI00135207E4|nr:hypothetical protein [Streptomyces lincolnensis]QMV09080.1 hypothetical protein GJU35_27860 [Streptomyces lincolnensis]
MFDLRTEAEMRLHSEKLAKELALKKQHEDTTEADDTPTTTDPTTSNTETEPDG